MLASFIAVFQKQPMLTTVNVRCINLGFYLSGVILVNAWNFCGQNMAAVFIFAYFCFVFFSCNLTPLTTIYHLKKIVITYTIRKVLNAEQKNAELMFSNCLESLNFRFKFRIFKSGVLFCILYFSMFMKNPLNRNG